MKRSILFPILAVTIAGLIYLFYPHLGMMGGHSMDHASMEDVKPAKTSASATVGDITVSNGWAKATLPGQPAGGGFVTLANKGATADALISVTSPVSSNVQIHEMSMDSDVMKMRELINGLAIPAGATVEMKPGGFHIMFMDLKEAFKEDKIVKVTLKFTRAGEVTLDLPVNPIEG
jgi:periplasmic copper chaperone A